MNRGLLPIPAEPHDVSDIEQQWAAWNARCQVSHSGFFAEARNASVAFHPPAKQLAELRVALATSGGIYVRTDPPFDMESHAGDDSLRWIPATIETCDLRIAHDHYDHTDAD